MLACMMKELIGQMFWISVQYSMLCQSETSNVNLAQTVCHILFLCNIARELFPPGRDLIDFIPQVHLR